MEEIKSKLPRVISQDVLNLPQPSVVTTQVKWCQPEKFIGY